MEEQIIELQTRIAFQEDALLALTKTVTEQQREILQCHQKVVPFHKKHLERRIGARPDRVLVIHHGGGRGHRLPACPACAQPQVGVFAIHEEALVQEPDLAEHLSPIEGRATAGQEYRIQVIILPVVTFAPAG